VCQAGYAGKYDLIFVHTTFGEVARWESQERLANHVGQGHIEENEMRNRFRKNHINKEASRRMNAQMNVHLMPLLLGRQSCFL
jgi:hypothetical protein